MFYMANLMSENQGNRIIDKLDKFFQLEIDQPYKLVSYNSLKLSEIDEIIDDCFLARRSEGKNQFLFFGKNIIKSVGDGDSSNIENLVFSNNHELTNKFQNALSQKSPILDEDSFINKDKLEVRYRQKLYPLLNDEGKLEYIFGGIRWKTII